MDYSNVNIGQESLYPFQDNTDTNINATNNPLQPLSQTDATVRKRLFPTPSASAIKSRKFPRNTLSPMSTHQYTGASKPSLPANNFEYGVPSSTITDSQNNHQFLMNTPQPSRVETLTDRRRPSIVNIQGTPSIRKRIVATNSSVCQTRQAIDLAAWLNHELLHPLFYPNVDITQSQQFHHSLQFQQQAPYLPTTSTSTLPQYRLSQDATFLRFLIDLHKFFHSDQITSLMHRIGADLRLYNISFKQEIDLKNHGQSQQFIRFILLNFHPAWLLPALSVLFKQNFAIDLDLALYAARQASSHEDAPERQEKELGVVMQFLDDIIRTTILSPHPLIFSRISPETSVPSSPRPPEVNRSNFHSLVLRRVLELVFLLDAAKTSDSGLIMHADPPLFRTDSIVKSTAEFLSTLDREYISDVTNLRQFFKLRGFRVKYEVPSCETRRSMLITNFQEDLRDGIRLCKIASLITRDRNLLYKVKVPSGRDMQREIQIIKQFNVELAMRTMIKFAMSSMTHRFVWYATPADIVSGNVSKTISFIWQVAALWRDTFLLNTEDLKAELDIVNVTFRENKRIIGTQKPRLSQSPTTDMPLSEIPASIESPSNLCVYEKCDNPSSDLLLKWSAVVCGLYGLAIRDFTESFRDGSALCIILQHYYPGYVQLREISRVSAVELRTTEVFEFETATVRKNFDLFMSRVRKLSNFPLIPISVEAALEQGFISLEKNQSVGRPMDLILSYLFNELMTQKCSVELMRESESLLREARNMAIQDQAARVIVHALQHVNVRQRMETIESNSTTLISGFALSPSSHRNQYSTSPSQRRTSSALRVRNGKNMKSAEKSGSGSASKQKPPIPSPFSGPTSYDKYLSKSPIVTTSHGKTNRVGASPNFNASPRRSPKTTTLDDLLNSTNAKSPMISSSHNRITMQVSASPRKNIPFANDNNASANIETENDQSRKKWAVDVISRHYLTFKQRRDFLNKKQSAVLLQAAVRGYLTRKQFMDQLDAMQNCEAETEQTIAETEQSIASTIALDDSLTNSPTKEEMVQLMSPAASSFELTMKVLPKIHDHMEALQRYANRMKELEAHLDDKNPGLQNIIEEGIAPTAVHPAPLQNTIEGGVASTTVHPVPMDTSATNDDNSTEHSTQATSSVSHDGTPQSPYTSEISTTPQSAASPETETSNAGSGTRASTSLESSPQAETPASISQPEQSTPVQRKKQPTVQQQVRAQPQLSAAQLVPPENQTQAPTSHPAAPEEPEPPRTSLWRGLRWARAIVKSLRFVGGEVAQQVDNSMSDANEAMAAASSAIQLNEKIENIQDRIEEVAAVRQSATRRHRTPRPQPSHPDSPSSIGEGANPDEFEVPDRRLSEPPPETPRADVSARRLLRRQVVNEEDHADNDVIEDGVYEMAENNFNEVFQNRFRENTEEIENRRKRKLEISKNLHHLDEQVQQDSVAQQNSIRKVKKTIQFNEEMFSSLDDYLTEVESVIKHCDEAKDEANRRYSEGPSMEEKECVQEKDAMDDIVKEVKKAMLEDRLNDAEVAFIDSMSVMNSVRRKREKIDSFLHDLDSSQAREEIVIQADLANVQEQLRKADNLPKKFEDLFKRISDIESWCKAEVDEISFPTEWEAPLLSPSHSIMSNEVEEINDLYDELTTSRLTEGLRKAEESFEDEMASRRFEAVQLWSKKRRIDLDSKDWMQNAEMEMQKLKDDIRGIDDSLERVKQRREELEDIETPSTIRENLKFIEDSDDESEESERYMHIIEPTPDQVAAVNLMASSAGLFSKIQKDRDQTLLEEALSKANDKFEDEMTQRAFSEASKWAERKQLELDLRKLDEETKEAFRLEQEESNELCQVQAHLDAEKAEHESVFNAVDGLEQACTSAEKELKSISNIDFSETKETDSNAEESERTFQADESALKKERLSVLHENAVENFTNFCVSTRVTNMSDWVRRKELELNIKEILQDENSESKSYEEALQNTETDLERMAIEFEDNKSAVMESCSIAEKKIREAVNMLDEFIVSDGSLDDAKLNGLADTLNIDMLLEDLFANITNDRLAELLESAETNFNKTMKIGWLRGVSEWCHRRESTLQIAELRLAQTKEHETLMSEISELELDLSTISEIYERNQINDIEEGVEIATFDDVCGNDDSLNEWVEALLEESRTFETLVHNMFANTTADRLIELHESAETNFNKTMKIGWLRGVSEWCHRRESTLQIAELRLAQTKEHETLMSEISELELDLSTISEIYERNQINDIEEGVEIATFDDVCGNDDSLIELAAALEEEYRAIKVCISSLNADHAKLEDILDDVPVARSGLETAAEHEQPLSPSIDDEVHSQASEAFSPLFELDSPAAAMASPKSQLTSMSPKLLSVPELLTRNVDNDGHSQVLDASSPLFEMDRPEALETSCEAGPISTSPEFLSAPEPEPELETVDIENDSVSDIPTKKIAEHVLSNASEEEEIPMPRQSQKLSDRRPFQDVSSEHKVTQPIPQFPLASGILSTPSRAHFAREEYAPLFATEEQSNREREEEEEDFVSLSSFASRPSSSVHRLQQHQQLSSPSARNTPATGLRSHTSIAQSPVPDGSVILGRLSEELDALRMQMSPPESSDRLICDAGSMDRLHGVMRRISVAAATPMQHEVRMVVRQGPRKNNYIDGPSSSLGDVASAATSMPWTQSILRNVLMVMRQCIRSEKYTTLVRLGMKIVRDFCAVQSCISDVICIENSIDIISTCVQFYRDDEKIFATGADILHVISSDEEGRTALKQSQCTEIIDRLAKVKSLVEEHVERSWRNKVRKHKAELVILALKKRKAAGSAPVKSMAEEVGNVERSIPKNTVVTKALNKLCTVIERSREEPFTS